MVQIDIPAAFVVSMFSIDIGRKRLLSEVREAGRQKPTAYYQYLLRSIFFASFVIAPAGIYLLTGWPGWEQIYWSHRFERVLHNGWANPMLSALFIMAIVACAYFGHVLGYKWLTNGRQSYIRPTYIAVLLIVTVVVLINYPSFLYVGTYDQYHNLAGQTREEMENVWSNPYGFSVAWVMVMVYFTLASLYLIWTIRKEVTRAPTAT